MCVSFQRTITWVVIRNYILGVFHTYIYKYLEEFPRERDSVVCKTAFFAVCTGTSVALTFRPYPAGRFLLDNHPHFLETKTRSICLFLRVFVVEGRSFHAM